MVKGRIEAILENEPNKTYVVEYKIFTTEVRVVEIVAKSEEELEEKINSGFETIKFSDIEDEKVSYKILEEKVEDFPQF